MQKKYTPKKGRRLLSLLQRLIKRSWLCVALLSGPPCLAETVSIDGSGQYSFGPDTSEKLACELAEEQLIRNTARSYFGERIEFDETQLCSSARARSSGVACDLDQRMFFSPDENLLLIDVSIARITVRYPQQTKIYTCDLIGTVRFGFSESSMDRSWATDLEVDNELLDIKRRLSFKANSSKEGFHYIFEDEGPRGFKLIYPNELDASRKILGGFAVPSSSAIRSYKLSLESDGVDRSGQFLRFLMLSTKNKLNLNSLSNGLISRERMALLKEDLESGAWTEKKIESQAVY